MKKRILLILLLLLIPFCSFAEEQKFLGHILWAPIEGLSLGEKLIFSPPGAYYPLDAIAKYDEDTTDSEGRFHIESLPKCKELYKDNNMKQRLENINFEFGFTEDYYDKGNGCAVCNSSSNVLYKANEDDKNIATAIPYDALDAIKAAFNVSDAGTISISSAKLYHCNNGVNYYYINVYFTPQKAKLIVNVNNNSGGQIAASTTLNKTNDDWQNSIEFSEVNVDDEYYIDFKASDGYELIRVTDSAAPETSNVHSNLNDDYMVKINSGDIERTVTAYFTKKAAQKCQVEIISNGGGKVSSSDRTTLFSSLNSGPSTLIRFEAEVGQKFSVNFHPDSISDPTYNGPEFKLIDVTVVRNGQTSVNEHKDLTSSYNLEISEGITNLKVYATFAEIKVTPAVRIAEIGKDDPSYDNNDLILSSIASNTAGQLVKITDYSNYTFPTFNGSKVTYPNTYLFDETYTGKAYYRIWRLYEHHDSSFSEPLKKSHVYNMLTFAEQNGISLPIDKEYYNSEELLLDRTFYWYIPFDGAEYAFQVAHHKNYLKTLDPSALNKGKNGSADYIYATARVLPDNYVPIDFDIFYTPANSTTPIRVTDDDTWTNDTKTTQVELISTMGNLNTLLMNWTASDPSVTITKNDVTGNASAIIHANTRVDFTLQYDTRMPVSHYTQYTNNNPGKILLTLDMTSESSIDITGKSGNIPIKLSVDKITPSTTNGATIDNNWEIQVWIVGQADTDPSNPSNPLGDKYLMGPNGTGSTLLNDTIENCTPTFTIPYDQKSIAEFTWLTSPTAKDLHFTAYGRLIRIDRTEYSATTSDTSITSLTLTTQKITLNPNISLNLNIASQTPIDITGKSTSDVVDIPLEVNNINYTSSSTTIDNNWEIQIWIIGEVTSSSSKYLLGPNGAGSTLLNTQIESCTPTFTIPYNQTHVNGFNWSSSASPKNLLFTAYGRLIRIDCTECSPTSLATSTTELKVNTPPPVITTVGTDHFITAIDKPTIDITSGFYEAGSQVKFNANISETNTITINANQSILNNNTSSYTYGNTSSTLHDFSNTIQLTQTGDYDTGTNYNILTLTANNPNPTSSSTPIHTASQNIVIKPNWYLKPDPNSGATPSSTPNPFYPSSSTSSTIGNRDDSALKIISVRDIRWQRIYNQTNKPNWGISTATGNKTLLDDLTVNGTNISHLKKGYSVEFELTVTDNFANYLRTNPNANITITTNAAEAGQSSYSTIELNTTAANDPNNKFLVRMHDNCKRWTFVYYLPPTIPSSINGKNTFTNKFTSIIAYNGTASIGYNWLDFAKSTYGWQGNVFTYDLTKSNLDDLYNNAN